VGAEFHNVLFICTGNSARSIIAEGLMNAMAAGRFRAYSAGSHPKGVVHPMALRVLRDARVPTDGLRSKSWDEFAGPEAPRMDFVFTVCDQAAGEVCPLWPGQPITAHWGMPDPAAIEADDDVQAKAFLDTVITLRRRLELLLALPVHTLQTQATSRRVKDIGLR
jgi:arsenate reductase (thioredoxin)